MTGVMEHDSEQNTCEGVRKSRMVAIRGDGLIQAAIRDTDALVLN